MWYRARYSNYESVPASDLSTANEEHAAAVLALETELRAAGYELLQEADTYFVFRHPAHSAFAVSGQPDVVARSGLEMTVFEVKTGAAQAYHETQALLYSCLLPRAIRAYRTTAFSTVLVYPGVRRRLAEDSSLPKRLELTLAVLAEDDEPEKRPGRLNCEQCDIASRLCPERFG